VEDQRWPSGLANCLKASLREAAIELLLVGGKSGAMRINVAPIKPAKSKIAESRNNLRASQRSIYLTKLP